jgi:hypothetical protein
MISYCLLVLLFVSPNSAVAAIIDGCTLASRPVVKSLYLHVGLSTTRDGLPGSPANAI